MRILITGMTALQVGRSHRLGVISTSALIAQALRDAGHDVDHRQTEPSEPLAGYDAVLAGLADPTSFSAGKRWTGLDAIGRALAEGSTLGFYVDDWRLQQLRNGIDYLHREPKRLVKPMWQKSRHYHWAIAHLDYLAWVVDALATRPWPVTIAPQFEWGDDELLRRWLPSRQLEFIDPTGYVPPVEVESPARRERTWVSAALTQNDRWLRERALSWPIERIGQKKRDEPQVTEAEVIARYAQVWGVLCAPYNHAGSGWWRVRYVHAAQTGAVLSADTGEVERLGGSYLVAPQQVEAMTDAQLAELAAKQREELRRWVWPRSRLCDEMHRIVTTL